MGKLTITENTTYKGEDTIRIIKSRRRQRFRGYLTIVRFQDADTKQFVIYNPTLEVTGYGETMEKAKEMIIFSIEEFFESLIPLSSKQLESELRRFGWKQDKIKNKNYSKLYVDTTGELQNLNAVDNKVEILTLEAA